MNVFSSKRKSIVKVSSGVFLNFNGYNGLPIEINGLPIVEKRPSIPKTAFPIVNNGLPLLQNGLPLKYLNLIVSNTMLFMEVLLNKFVFQLVCKYVRCYTKLLLNKLVNKCQLIFDCCLCLRDTILCDKLKSSDFRILFTSRKCTLRLTMSISFVFN